MAFYEQPQTQRPAMRAFARAGNSMAWRFLCLGCRAGAVPACHLKRHLHAPAQAVWLPARLPGLQVALQNSGTNALDLAQLLPKQWQAFLKG